MRYATMAISIEKIYNHPHPIIIQSLPFRQLDILPREAPPPMCCLYWPTFYRQGYDNIRPIFHMMIMNEHLYTANLPISRITQYIRQISHNASFFNRNVHTCAHFCYKMVHREVWDWCTVGFVRLACPGHWDKKKYLIIYPLKLNQGPFSYNNVMTIGIGNIVEIRLLFWDLMFPVWSCNKVS